MWEKPLRQKVVNTHKHRGSKLSSKLSVIIKTLFEEQQGLLYRAIYPINNCTKDNRKITVRPVVDRVKDLDGKNQCYPKKPFARGEDKFHCTRE